MKESPNVALRNDSFRNYADYMLTPEFATGIDKFLDISQKGPVAIMCAERVYFHCHRMLVSDYLSAHGQEVLHIDDAKPAKHEYPASYYEELLQHLETAYAGQFWSATPREVADVARFLRLKAFWELPHIKLQ